MTKVYVFLFLFFALTDPVSAANYTVSGSASFDAEGVPLMSFTGTGGKVTGSATEDAGLVSGTFKVPVKDFTTDMELRDDHMKNKYLEAAKYPEIILEISGYKKGDANFKGFLTVRGVKKPLAGKVKIEGQKILANFDVKLSDHGITGVSYAGVGVKDVIKAKVDLEFK